MLNAVTSQQRSSGERIAWQLPSGFSHHLMALIATLLIAGSFLATERVATLTNPMSLTLFRFLGASLLLVPYVLKTAERRRQIISHFPRGLILGFFYSMFFVCFFQSLKTTTVINTGSLHTLAPFLTAILALVIFGDRISMKKIAAYMLGVIATVWVIFQGDFELMKSLSLNSGDLIYVVGIVLMCCFSVSMKLFNREGTNIFVLVFCVLVSGSLWMGGSMAVTGKSLGWENFTAESILSLGYLIVFATIGTVYLFQRATPVIGPGKVMAYGYLTPGAVALLQLALTGDHIPAIVWPGIILSVAATVILQFTSHKQKDQKNES